MKIAILPAPPSANDPNFNQAVVDWMSKVKGILEGASRINDTPLGQQFVVGTYSTTTAVSGTTTGTDLSNFVSSFVTAMIAKGMVSQTIARSNP